MWKLIKLELGKSNLKLDLLKFLAGAIVVLFLAGMMGYEDYSLIVMMSSIFIGIQVFDELYMKEKKNKTLKISLITPVGMKKVIKAKLIVSILAPIAMFIILIVIRATLITPQYLFLEIPSIISELFFVINFVMIAIYLNLVVSKEKSKRLEVLIPFASIILIKLIKDINITPIIMIGIGTVILVILIILFKSLVVKSILAEDIL
ncbi:MAG: ABC-2 transporter permease [Clostridium sp.]